VAYRINLNKRTVCYVVKNSLPGKRGEKHSKIRDVKKQKLADLTGGGNSNDIAHRSLIQVNTVWDSVYAYRTLHIDSFHIRR